MQSNRVVSDNFYNQPNLVLAFQPETGIEAIENHPGITQQLSTGLTYNCYQPDEIDSSNTFLQRDLARNPTCNNLSYKKNYLASPFNYVKYLYAKLLYQAGYKKDSYEDEFINAFIKETLKLNPIEFNTLTAFYIQPVAFLFLSGMQSSVALSDIMSREKKSEQLFLAAQGDVNFYKDENNKIHLEVKSTKLNLSTPNGRVECAIPGTIAYQYVLTPVGFKLEKFAASNQLLLDLCTNQTIDAADFWKRLDAETALAAQSTTGKPSSFWAQHWPSFAIGLGLTVAVAGVIALGVFTLGLAPALIAIGGAITAGALSGTAALLAGGAALVVGAVASYATLLSGAIGLTTLWEKFSNKGTIPPTEPVSDSGSESYSTTSDEENVLNNGNLIKALNAQPEPTSKQKLGEPNDFILEDEDSNEDTLNDLPEKGDNRIFSKQKEPEESFFSHKESAFKAQ